MRATVNTSPQEQTQHPAFPPVDSRRMRCTPAALAGTLWNMSEKPEMNDSTVAAERNEGWKMQFFHGDLLIGGATFRRLHGQLKLEEPSPDSTDWQLAGRLELTRRQVECLELNRQYRLELEDGRAGAVVVSRVDASEIGAVVDFEPPRRRPK